MAKKNKSSNSKKASGGVGSKKAAKSRSSNSSSPPSSTSGNATLLSSVLVVFVAIAIAGGFHLSRSGAIDSSTLSSTSDAASDTTTTDANPNKTTTKSSSSSKTSAPLPAGPEISIATFHQIDESLGDLTLISDTDKDSAAEKQRRDLMTYIQYDDGYASCLTTESGTESDMFGARAIKKFKYEFLQKVANRRDFWVTELPPNAQRVSGPELIASAEHLRTLCRMLTLSHEDYEGRAKAVLQKAMSKGDIYDNLSVKSQGNASDYRTAVCLHRLTDPAFNAKATTKEEKLAKAALTKVRYEWAKDIADLKKKALAEPPRPIPEGWSVHREEDNGYLYYLNQATAKSSWVKPVPVFGGKGVIVDYPPPAENGKHMLASVTARKKPCPIEDTIAVVTGVPSTKPDGESSGASFKVSASGAPDGGTSKKNQPKVTVTKKTDADSAGGATFKVAANGGESSGASFKVTASGPKGGEDAPKFSVTAK